MMRFLVLGGGLVLPRVLLGRGHRVAVVIGRRGEPVGLWEQLGPVMESCSEVSDDSLVLEVTDGDAVSSVVDQALSFLGGCDGVLMGVAGRRSGRSPGPRTAAPWFADGPLQALIAEAASRDAIRDAVVVVASMIGGRSGRFDPPGLDDAAVEMVAAEVTAAFGRVCRPLDPRVGDARVAVVLESLVAGEKPPDDEGFGTAESPAYSLPGSFTTRDGVTIEISGPHADLAAAWARALEEGDTWPLAMPRGSGIDGWLASLAGPIDAWSLPLARTLTLADRLEASSAAVRPMMLTLDDVAALMPARQGWICRVPVDDPSDALAVLAFSSPNHNLKPHHHTASLRRWHRRYGAVPAWIDGDSLIIYAARPPERMPDAVELAREHLNYCGESMVLEQHGLPMEEITDLDSAVAVYAPALIGLRHWKFWWD